MKKLYLILICLLILSSLVGCNTNKNNLSTLAINESQSLSDEDKTKVENFFNTVDDIIDNYPKLAKEFKENYRTYSKEEFQEFSKRVDENVAALWESKHSIEQDNVKIEYIANELSNILNILMISADSPFMKDMENRITTYNNSITRMTVIMNNKDNFKKEVLEIVE